MGVTPNLIMTVPSDGRGITLNGPDTPVQVGVTPNYYYCPLQMGGGYSELNYDWGVTPNLNTGSPIGRGYPQLEYKRGPVQVDHCRLYIDGGGGSLSTMRL